MASLPIGPAPRREPWAHDIVEPGTVNVTARDSGVVLHLIFNEPLPGKGGGGADLWVYPPSRVNSRISWA